MEGFETVAMTPRGEVDLVAVERVMNGSRCDLTAAEVSYLLWSLVVSLRDKPAANAAGKMHDAGDEHQSNPSWDRRIQSAADGLGVTAKGLSVRLSKHRTRWGFEIPPAFKTPGVKPGTRNGNSPVCYEGHARRQLPGGKWYGPTCHGAIQRRRREKAGA